MTSSSTGCPLAMYNAFGERKIVLLAPLNPGDKVEFRADENFWFLLSRCNSLIVNFWQLEFNKVFIWSIMTMGMSFKGATRPSISIFDNWNLIRRYCDLLWQWYKLWLICTAQYNFLKSNSGKHVSNCSSWPSWNLIPSPAEIKSLMRIISRGTHKKLRCPRWPA